MIVVDTNLIGYLFLPSERSSQADRVLRKDPLWAAPVLWRSELRNVLAHYIRREQMSVEGALEIMAEALDVLQDHEYEVPSLPVLRLAASSACSAYDCEFVALAQDLRVPLVTVDGQVLKDFPSTAVPPEVFLSN